MFSMSNDMNLLKYNKFEDFHVTADVSKRKREN